MDESDDDSENCIKNFFGVYLLFSKNEKYKGRTYIGYTVNPNRRVNQHNKGHKAGGAKRTSDKGPWDMVLIIHGFPNDISALRFEWAWQHPEISTRLKHVSRKKTSEKKFDFLIRVLSEMLTVGPWNRLPLTIRWLNQEYITEFPVGKNPPMHMPIAYGPVTTVKTVPASQALHPVDRQFKYCFLCKEIVIDKDRLDCLSSDCSMSTHIICLARRFTANKFILPVEGNCPRCNMLLVWGNLIRKAKEFS